MSHSLSHLFLNRWRLLACGLLLLGSTTLVHGDEADPDEPAEEPLPLISEMVVPTMNELLTDDPKDWVILKFNPKGGVLVTQPIYPRPDTLKKKVVELENLSSSKKRPKQLPDEPQDEYRERLKELRDEALILRVSLPEDPEGDVDNAAAEYKLPTREIDYIKYHEDLMVDRVNLLMNEGKLAKAFELLLVIQRRNKSLGRVEEWPGYNEANNRLLFEEAKLRVQSGQLEQALAFYEDLWALDPKYRGLRTGIGEVVDQLITAARGEQNLRKARFYLLRLNELDEKHPTVVKWVGDFIAETDKLLAASRAARNAKRYDEAFLLAKEATTVWPPHKGLKIAFDNAARRFQVLNVGVTRFPSDKTPFFLPTQADRRHHSLLASDLFEVRELDRSAYYQSRYFEEWDPTDLGREIIFTLRSRRKAWEATPLLDADDVVRSISSRLLPGSKYYDERLATFVSSMDVKSPYKFVVNFNTVPVRPQALFRFPIHQISNSVSATDESPADGDEANPVSSPLDSLISRRFRVHKREENKISFRRVMTQPDNMSRYRVAEVIEHRYPTKEIALQALLKGDISVLPNPPIWLVDQIALDERFNVQKYSMPTTHVLQFNPDSKPLKNSQFRRALSFMLDRERILTETLLRDGPLKDEGRNRRGRLTASPFPQISYATNQDIKPHPRDLPLAFSLLTVSKKQFGGKVPDLVMLCEPDETVRLAAEQLQIQWKRIGVNVKIVYNSDEATPENWDIVYRTVKMTEPITQLWPFLTMKPNARVEDLEHLPDWLRQQLIELEQAVDFKEAVELLQTIHGRLDQLEHIIPLWEIDDVIIFRKSTVNGLPTQLLSPFHNIERWIVNPWYATDLL